MGVDPYLAGLALLQLDRAPHRTALRNVRYLGSISGQDVTDGPSILAELQARGLAGPDLEYDEVIAELGEGTPAVLVLSGRREHGIDGVVVLTADEHNLIDQLVAVARALWIAEAV